MKIKVKNDATFKKLNAYKIKKGLKSSAKRTIIIDYFLKHNRHFSVEELYNRLKKISPKIGYSTVYRTLKLLVDCGIASIRRFEKNKTSFEPVHKKEHHDHIICLSCGRIIEFVNQEIEKLQKKIARRFYFRMKDHKLEIYGQCQKCSKKKGLNNGFN